MERVVTVSQEYETHRAMNNQMFCLGIDVGSTTVKTVIVEPASGRIIDHQYVRHNARQGITVANIVAQLSERYPDVLFRIAVCGSGGRPVAEALQVTYIQEVVANAIAIRMCYSQVNTAIELGGQDAKIIFFDHDEQTGEAAVHDMRMNGSCAGGTGAFIDEIATLLKVPTEEFDTLAAQGTRVYDISGRCGVFAKTDIQPLLLRGARCEDIALSTFHAIAKQTIGGLSQGLELRAPIIFEGGPLTFNPTLIRVFADRLALSSTDIIVPEHPETIVAYGAALALNEQSMRPSATLTLAEISERLATVLQSAPAADGAKPFFLDDAEREAFSIRHTKEEGRITDIGGRTHIPIYIGIDSGSTTSKFVFIDESGGVIEQFYTNNNGAPLDALHTGLLTTFDRYRQRGITLTVLGVGTTGYGEHLVAEAFGADYHTVETIAHARGCLAYVPDATFILDIGGQDMKAIRLNDGIVTQIMLNEACSSGCGSFLENYAHTLHIPVEAIAEAAFRSTSPASLGSRCTVFMNSTIIHEQRMGKSVDDIMAGLCRAIIENVFTKVVRIADTTTLGLRVVVQGGTFRNAAVVRAIEEYLGREVTVAPFPRVMGAIGVALLTKEKMERSTVSASTRFVGLDKLRTFTYTTSNDSVCNGCSNQCCRTVVHFSTGNRWITGNRCERGGIAAHRNVFVADNLFTERERLWFAEYDYRRVDSRKQLVIGIPRVLEFWESYPFWNTFFQSLGYKVLLSPPSTQAQYERGISYVASDTICFPAKLVHGHIDDLVRLGADIIFMPYVMHTPPEGVDQLSPYMCSVLQGYPMVVRHSQSLEQRYGIPFHTPEFHWFTSKNRKRQIIAYVHHHLGISEGAAEMAYQQGEAILAACREKLVARGRQLIVPTTNNHDFAVVLAGRPYQCDELVNHRIAYKLTRLGIPVLTVDSLPEINTIDLSHTRVEITNNYHTRMLAAALIAARTPMLEYVQIVSFGCGHDAILTDEITRILEEVGGKHPLVLKVDESAASGALDIRIQSFVESVRIRRTRIGREHDKQILRDAYPVKFTLPDKKRRTLLIPNISEGFSILLCAVLEREGFRVKTVPIGGTGQIRLGKRYSHNDICFPCQMVIGELIDALRRGGYRPEEVAVGMVKFQCDCRMAHYAALLRKALDNAGYEGVPIVTTDANDTKGMQPGVHLLGISTVYSAVWGLMMLDVLSELARKTRPYEFVRGTTDCIFRLCLSKLADGLRRSVGEAKRAFAHCINLMAHIPYERTRPRPIVYITGELLVTYHEGSNFHIERYLEEAGMETAFPRLTDQLRKDFLAQMSERRDFKAAVPRYPFLVNGLFDRIHRSVERIASRHPLHTPSPRPIELYEGVAHIIPHTLSCGEGWLMAAEIVHHARLGVKAFIILQPFGCLPNHICGRGVVKRLKEEYPHIQILPLDLDPDTSYTNVENRLQMLILNTKN